MAHSLGVLGLGNWGTAIADLLARNSENSGALGRIKCWDIDSSVLDYVSSNRKHPRYHTGVTLHEGVHPVYDVEEVFQQEIVFLVFPSSALAEVLKGREISPSTTLVSAIKGLEPKTLLTPLQFAHKLYPGHSRLAVVSGPSFSTDVIHQKPVGLVVASKDPVVAREVAGYINGQSVRPYFSSDPLGVETGGVFKNVIALATGVVDGMELGDSARAAFITRGLAEITRLAMAMGAEERTLSGLSGLGDLVMTASSSTSRNRTVGYRLGKGEKLDEIISTLGSTAEAVKTAPVVLQLARDHEVEMPITEAVVDLLNEKATATEMVKRFISQPLKSEF